MYSRLGLNRNIYDYYKQFPSLHYFLLCYKIFIYKIKSSSEWSKCIFCLFNILQIVKCCRCSRDSLQIGLNVMIKWKTTLISIFSQLSRKLTTICLFVLYRKEKKSWQMSRVCTNIFNSVRRRNVLWGK